LLTQWDIDEMRKNDVLTLLQDQDSNVLYRLLEDDKKSVEEIKRLHQVLDLLQNQFSVNATLNMGIVRGLDYYTGIVFEVKAPSLGAEKQICGGGEYNLIELFGGRKTFTAGFALGFDRTILAMQEEQVSFPERGLDYYVVSYNDKIIPLALDVVNKLRQKHRFSCDVDLLRRGIGKALKYASSQNTAYVIILGPREVEEHKLTLRNMESGKQKEIDIDQFLENPSQYQF